MQVLPVEGFEKCPTEARGERALLGLLGRIVRSLCLLEIYGHMPHGAEWRACLGKHFAHWEAWARRVRAGNRQQKAKGLEPAPFVKPMLWILAVAFSKSMRRKLEVKSRPGWPKGVYFHGRDLHRVGIVVANELPRDRSTLLVRFMVAGPLLKDAIEDLAELPANAIERGLVEGDLVDLERTLGAKPSRTPQEEEIVAMVQGTFTEARKMGRAEGSALAVLTVLQARGIVVSDADREHILAEKDPACLERWLKRASLAASLADVIAEPSRAA